MREPGEWGTHAQRSRLGSLASFFKRKPGGRLIWQGLPDREREGWQQSGLIDSSGDPEDMAKALLALVLGFVVQAAIIGEVEPEMLSRGLHWIGKAATDK